MNSADKETDEIMIEVQWEREQRDAIHQIEDLIWCLQPPMDYSL